MARLTQKQILQLKWLCFANVDYMCFLESVSVRLPIDSEDRHIVLFLVNF